MSKKARPPAIRRPLFKLSCVLESSDGFAGTSAILLDMIRASRDKRFFRLDGEEYLRPAFGSRSTLQRTRSGPYLVINCRSRRRTLPRCYGKMGGSRIFSKNSPDLTQFAVSIGRAHIYITQLRKTNLGRIGLFLTRVELAASAWEKREDEFRAHCLG